MIRSLRRVIAASLAAVICLGPGVAQACSEASDCPVANGTYRLAQVPEARGALVFAHGYRGRAERVVQGRLRAFAHGRGLHLVALQSGGDDWTIRNAPTDGVYRPRDELAYVANVLADVAARTGIGPERILLVGFSAGAMLISELACHSALRPQGYVALAGTVWAPIPERCARSEVPFVQIHGANDRVVPLVGRAIADAHQGNVHDFLALLAEARAPTILPQGEPCLLPVQGTQVFFCLTKGGHSLDLDSLGRALDHIAPSP